MLPLSQILLGLVLPAGVAAGVMLCARGPSSGKGPAGGFAGLAIAAGYVAGHVGLRGIGPFPPAEATQWLPYLGLASAGLGAVDGFLEGRARWAGRLAGLTLLVGGLALLLRARMLHVWSAAESAAWIAGGGFVLAALWIVTQWAVRSLPVRSGWVVLVVVAAASAATITASGSLLLGLLGAALAAACGGAALVSMLVTSRGFERGSALAFTVLLAGLLLVAYFYSELPVASALLLGLAPLGSQLVPRRFASRRSEWTRAVLHGAAAAVPAAAALWVAIAASPPLAPYY